MPTPETDARPLLEIHDLHVQFKSEEGVVRAVQGVNLTVNPGETFGLVGESGCGKSVSALAIMQLIKGPRGRITQGEILFAGQDLLALSKREMRQVRGNEIAMIFQEPMTSLNPVWPVGWQVAEVLRIHRGMNRAQAWEEAIRALDRVGYPSPQTRATAFPHQLSGGMRQRAMIALAMACQPKLLLADEPTTALDVTIQAQILDLIAELQEENGMAVLLITHDFGVIAQVADRLSVMYAGRVVETTAVSNLFDQAHHPYTDGLLKSVPLLGAKRNAGRQRLYEIPGVVPRLVDDAPGCRFAPRCPRVLPACAGTTPPSVRVGRSGEVACLAFQEAAA